MADRSVVVTLRAQIAQHQAAMKQAKDSWTTFGQEVTGRGKTSRAEVEQLGRTALVAGAVMAAGFGKAIMTASDFEKQMSGVRAVSNASAEEMTKLSDAAIAAGASTKLAGVTAADAAMAESELVKAGVSVSDVLGGALMGSLTLAAAGQLAFADAATIAAQAMNIFDLKGEQVTHVADVLAAAANKSAADVGQLGDALRQGGLVAAQTGLSMEETVAALAAFADNALIGSDAGTSLKTMLQRLTPTSKEAAGLMEELGFSAYDANGNFIGLDELAGELRHTLAGMTTEQRNLTMATLFGSDAVRGANILYEEGAAGMRRYVEAVNDQGAAARMAAIQNDNLKGDVEALGGALESAFIENGSKATGALRGITQAVTGLVTGFSSLPSGMQSAVMGLGGIVTGGTLAIGVLGTLYPKFTQAKTALEGMGRAGNFLAGNLGKVAGGMTAIGAGLGVFATWQTVMGKAADRGEEFAASLSPDVFDFQGYDGLISKLQSVDDSWADLSHEATSSKAPWDADMRAEIGAAADGLLGYSDELNRIRQLARDLAPALNISRDAAVDFIMGQKNAGINILGDDYDRLAGEMATTFRETTSGTTASHQLADGMETLGSEIATVEEKAKALGEAIDGIFAPLDTRAAIDQFTSGLNDMRQHFEDADAAVGDARDRFDDAKQSLHDLLALPTDQRGSSWAAQVENARDAVVDAEADIQKAIEGTNRTLEGNSEAAIANRDMVDAMARDAAEAIEAAAQDQNMSMDEIMWMRGSMIAQMEGELEQLGLNKEQVGFYTDALREIPLGEIKTTAVLDTKEAEANALRLVALLLDIEAGVYRINGMTVVGGSTLAPQMKSLGGPVYAATGMFVPRGTDTVPAMLTPGEFVMRKSAVDRFGLGLMESINRGIMPLSGIGSSSVDRSRHTTFAPNYTIVTADPRAAAVESTFELRVMAAGMPG